MGPTSEQIQRAIEGVTGEFYKPRTTAGEFAQTGGEFAAALLGNRAGAARRVAQWVGSTFGAEGASRLAEALNLPAVAPFAKMAGGLAGGIIPGLVPRRAAPTPPPGGKPAPQMNVVDEPTGSGGTGPGQPDFPSASIESGGPRSTVVYAPHEGVPGESWWKFPGLREQPDPARFPDRAAAARKAREDYSNDPRSGWVNESGEDEIMKVFGIKTLPTVEAMGSFKAANQPNAKWQTNPLQVARGEVEVTGPYGEIPAPVKKRLELGETLRGYVDNQDASVAYRINRDVPDELKTSVFIPRNRKLTKEEMDQLLDVADLHDLGVTDSARGVLLYGEKSAKEVDDLLKGRLRDELRRTLPGAAPERVQSESFLVPYEKFLQDAQEGDRTATRYLANAFRQSPELLNDPALDRMVRARAAARLERDLDYARRTGDRPSEATMNSLRLLSEGGLPGLFKGLDRKDFLPALFFALGIPLVGREGEPD